MAVISKAGVNALFTQALGRAATQAELDYWTNRDKSQLTTALTTTRGVTRAFKDMYAPAPAPTPAASGAVSTGSGNAAGTGADAVVNPVVTTTADPAPTTTPVATPEAKIIEKAKLTPADEDRFRKESYWKYLADYGIEVPELTAKYGLPPTGYDPSKTQFGIAQAKFDQAQAVNGQSLGMNLDQLALDSRQNIADWNTLKADIEAGRLDATSNEATALANNLQAKTQALSDTRRSLSSKGTLFGGVAEVAAQRAATPYNQKEVDLRAQYDQAMALQGRRETAGQTNYQIAMDKYLGNKQSSYVKGGVDSDPLTAGVQAGYGGGKWDATTGTFTNTEFGLNANQAAAKGLTFFGTNPYDIMINREAERQRLLSGQMGAIGQNVTNMATDYYNF